MSVRAIAAAAAAPNPRLAVGGRAERVACDYLSARGYRVLETNYRCRRGELDIVAEHEGTLCFVEVRSRSERERDYGGPLESVGPRKRRRVVRAAEHYIHTRKIDGRRAMRFDVVGIAFTQDAVTIELVRDAFQCN